MISEEKQFKLIKENQNIRLKNIELENRIDKAIEYIKEAKEQDFMWTPIFMKELLNILEGE